MKSKVFCIVLITLQLIMIAGCTQHNNYINPSEDNTMKNPLNRYIEIYQINRDTFDAFVTAPALEILAETPEIFYPSEGVQRYFRQQVIPFSITSDFIAFACNPVNIQSFLSQNGINCQVTKVVILDAPNIPLTIWAGDGFITVNEQSVDEGYVYRCYTHSSFKEKFGCVSGSLNANGKAVSEIPSIKIYNSYADVPLLPVLEAFGAVVQNKGENQFAIMFCGKSYYLNTDVPNLYETAKEVENLLYLSAGGPMFVYKTEQILMVDTVTLCSVLRAMGQSISVCCDRTNRTIIITSADSSVSP